MECIAEIMYIHTEIKTRVTHNILVLITEPTLKGTQIVIIIICKHYLKHSKDFLPQKNK